MLNAHHKIANTFPLSWLSKTTEPRFKRSWRSMRWPRATPSLFCLRRSKVCLRPSTRRRGRTSLSLSRYGLSFSLKQLSWVWSWWVQQCSTGSDIDSNSLCPSLGTSHCSPKKGSIPPFLAKLEPLGLGPAPGEKDSIWISTIPLKPFQATTLEVPCWVSWHILITEEGICKVVTWHGLTKYDIQAALSQLLQWGWTPVPTLQVVSTSSGSKRSTRLCNCIWMYHGSICFSLRPMYKPDWPFGPNLVWSLKHTSRITSWIKHDYI